MNNNLENISNELITINNLNQDILINISFFIANINDVINFSNTNKEIYNLFDDNYYMLWAINKYTCEFWINALLRNKEISKPLNNMKLELIRIFKFQEKLKKNLFPEWNNEDFYIY